MRFSLKSENFKNFLYVLFFVCSIYIITFAITFYHQYQVITSRQMADQYDQKEAILNLINLDLELIAMCRGEINNSPNVEKKDLSSTMECMRYPSDFDNDIQTLSKYFSLDSDTSQKISIIVNRKNPLILDQQSILITTQILDQLYKQLSLEEKSEKLPSYF